jgi:uncharacterized protein (TIGR02118 family)
MATLLALYSRPEDSAKFDDHYFTTHVPLAKKLPGLLSYQVSKGLTTLTGSGPHLVATLKFKSVADIQAALASPQGKAAAGDFANFASAGVTLMTFEDQEV